MRNESTYKYVDAQAAKLNIGSPSIFYRRSYLVWGLTNECTCNVVGNEKSYIFNTILKHTERLADKKRN